MEGSIVTIRAVMDSEQDANLCKAICFGCLRQGAKRVIRGVGILIGMSVGDT